MSSTVPSTNLIEVVISSPVPTLSGESTSGRLTGSPRALTLQMEAAEDDRFAHEMRSTTTVSVAATASAIVAVTSEPSKQPSEATIQLEAKESNR